jgi:hypothetical protein
VTLDEQPLPLQCPGVEGAHDLMIKDLALSVLPDVLFEAAASRVRERKQVGLERYGQLLCPENGRDTLRDAMEEALDLCAYLRNLIRLGHSLQDTYSAAVGVFLDLVIEQACLGELDLVRYQGITRLAAESFEGLDRG